MIRADNVAKWPGWDVIPLIDPTDPTDTARVPFMEAFSSSAPDFLKVKFVSLPGCRLIYIWRHRCCMIGPTRELRVLRGRWLKPPHRMQFKLFVTVSGVEEETLWDSVWWNDDVRQAWDSMATAQGDGAVAQETDATPRANAQVTPTPTRRLCARKLLQVK